MHHDPGDLGSLILIWITPKESTLSKSASSYLQESWQQKLLRIGALFHC